MKGIIIFIIIGVLANIPLAVSSQFEQKSAELDSSKPRSPPGSATASMQSPVSINMAQRTSEDVTMGLSSGKLALTVSSNSSQKLTVSVSGPDGTVSADRINQLLQAILNFNQLNVNSSPVLMRTGTGSLILSNVTTSLKEIQFSSCGCEAPISYFTKAAIETFIRKINVLSIDAEINENSAPLPEEEFPEVIPFNTQKSPYVASPSGVFSVELIGRILNGLKAINDGLIYPQKMVLVSQTGLRIKQSPGQPQPSPLFIITVSTEQMTLQSLMTLQNSMSILARQGFNLTFNPGPGPGPQSKLCYTYDSRGFCASCFEGFKLQLGYCVTNVVASYQGCSRIDTLNRCTECQDRYFLKNGMCAIVNLRCKDYQKSTGKCLNCYPGSVMKNGDCVAEATISMARVTQPQQLTLPTTTSTTMVSSTITTASILANYSGTPGFGASGAPSSGLGVGGNSYSSAGSYGRYGFSNFSPYSERRENPLPQSMPSTAAKSQGSSWVLVWKSPFSRNIQSNRSLSSPIRAESQISSNLNAATNSLTTILFPNQAPNGSLSISNRNTLVNSQSNFTNSVQPSTVKTFVKTQSSSGPIPTVTTISISQPRISTVQNTAPKLQMPRNSFITVYPQRSSNDLPSYADINYLILQTPAYVILPPIKSPEVSYSPSKK